MKMRKLGEIIEMAKSGEKPEYDELRLALCALDNLHFFTGRAIRTLADGERQGKKAFIHSAVFQEQEEFDRVKAALKRTPKELLGTSDDPDNPEVQKRRKIGMAAMDKIIAGQNPQAEVNQYVENVLGAFAAALKNKREGKS